MTQHHRSSEAIEAIRRVISKGNGKLDKSIWCINITGALNCPSAELGLCRVVDICYARNLERFRTKTVSPAMARATVTWDKYGIYYADAIIDMAGRAKANHLNYLRWNVFGDFRNQRDVYQADRTAWHVWQALGVTSYMYTTRSDLELPVGPAYPWIVVNGQHFMADNEITVVRKSAVITEDEHIKACPGKGCGVTCMRCFDKGGKEIQFHAHGSHLPAQWR